MARTLVRAFLLTVLPVVTSCASDGESDWSGAILEVLPSVLSGISEGISQTPYTPYSPPPTPYYAPAPSYSPPPTPDYSNAPAPSYSPPPTPDYSNAPVTQPGLPSAPTNIAKQFPTSGPCGGNYKPG